MILNILIILKILPLVRLQNKRKEIPLKGRSFGRHSSIISLEKRSLVDNDGFAAFGG